MNEISKITNLMDKIKNFDTEIIDYEITLKNNKLIIIIKNKDKIRLVKYDYNADSNKYIDYNSINLSFEELINDIEKKVDKCYFERKYDEMMNLLKYQKNLVLLYIQHLQYI